MKILFIIGSINQGGAEYQILELAKLFQEREHEIEVFALTDYSFYKPFIIKNKLSYNHLYNHQSRIKRFFLTAKRVKKYKPDLILSYLRSTSLVALFANKLSGSKSLHFVGERTSLILPRYDKVYFNLMRLTDQITFNSYSKLEYIKRKFPKLKNKLTFFPNIIDIKKFSFIKKEYKKKSLILGYVGRISKEKNIINLIKAAKYILEEGNDIKLYIYGDARSPSYKMKIDDLIISDNLENYVFLKGKLDDVNIAYKKIDLLCLISDYEGFSNVISEAISCGLPVVTSDIEENKYLIEDKINGFVVDHKNAVKIKNGIEDYINLSIENKLNMALTNRKKAERIFDNEKIYNDYINLFLKRVTI